MPGNSVQDLAEAVSRRLDERPGKILYLSRNDLEPARALELVFPDAKVTCYTKADFQGRSALQIWRQLRREKYDVFVVHDRTSFHRRLADFYRLIAMAVKARRRFLLSADIERGGVDAWSLEEIEPLQAAPGLAGRLMVEAAALGPALLFTPARLKLAPRRRALRFERKKSYTIAYLRTDYAFDITAGGSVSHISGVTGGMAAAGHSVYFIASDMISDIDRDRMPVTVIPPGREIRVFDEGAMIAYHHRFVREARPVLEKTPPDILYQRHSIFNAAGAWLSRSLGIPLILEANNSEVWTRARWSRLQMRRLAEQMERFAFQGADVISTVSRIAADQIIEAGAPRDRILVNPNGVDPNRFRPDVDGLQVRRALGFGPDDLVCGFLGTFTRWHGVLFLAGQVADLVRRHPRVRFLFMGDGDLRSAAEDRIESAGAGRACAFTGLIGHDRVPAHLAACDVLISPHLPFEDGTPFFGSPTKLFEYMAMGRAVVASNLGQIGEVIEPGRSGLLFEPGSGAEFQACLDRVLEDDELRERLGAGARRRVIESFTWERNVERVIRFLEERVAGAAPGAATGAAHAAAPGAAR